MPLDRLLAPDLLPLLTLGLLAALVLLLLAVLVALLGKPGSGALDQVGDAARAARDGTERLERTLHEQTVAMRGEAEQRGRALREEVGGSVRGFADSLQARVGDLGRRTEERLDRLTTATGQQLAAVRETVETRLTASADRAQAEASLARSESEKRGTVLRSELLSQLATLLEEQRAAASVGAEQQSRRLGEMAVRLAELSEKTEQRFEAMRTSLAGQLDRLREENGRKLDEMRQMVDEKLQKTLEQRLGESFKLVSDQLNSVYQGLGEMRQVAGEVGDLKRLMSNVKTRGGWAEVQLEAMLEQFLHPSQYEKNCAVRPGSGERVEFAIRLPSKDEDGRFVLLPIDAKFPKEDYERLVDALERADLDAVQIWGRALEDRLRTEARRIRDKYIDPPNTTDFAMMFVPTEGLYAEVARRPALLSQLQGELRVMVAGPSTLGAMLNSLQMGFRTLAISQRSGEVWKILGAAKAEFGRFADTIEKVRRSIESAGKSLDTVGSRTRAIERSLRGVEAVDGKDAVRLIGPPITEEEERRDAAE
jgi:DNA recombination protein RmuC